MAMAPNVRMQVIKRSFDIADIAIDQAQSNDFRSDPDDLLQTAVNALSVASSLACLDEYGPAPAPAPAAKKGIFRWPR